MTHESLRGGEVTPLMAVSADNVLNALTIARHNPKTFAGDEQAWLREHNQLFLDIILHDFRISRRTSEEPTALAGMSGGLFGNFVVRKTALLRNIDYEVFSKNFNLYWFANRHSVFKFSELPPIMPGTVESMSPLIGQELAEALQHLSTTDSKAAAGKAIFLLTYPFENVMQKYKA